jgi:hypothetical protein
LVVALKEIVLDYSPSTHLLKRIINSQDNHTVKLTSNLIPYEGHQAPITHSLKPLGNRQVS